MEFQRFPSDVAYPGASAHSILRFQAERGDFGAVADLEAEVEKRLAIMRRGAHYERRTASGRFIEFVFKPLDDGGLLAIYRDITELKDREDAIAAAKDAAEAARIEAEVSRAEALRTREVMQVVLDNMSDSVALLDKDFRLQFGNRQHMESRNYPRDVVFPGASGYDILRFQAQRGDYGRADTPEAIEAKVAEMAERMLKPGGNRYEAYAPGGRYIEYNFTPLDDGGMLAIYRDITELKQRENALAAAKEAAEEALAQQTATAEVLKAINSSPSDLTPVFDTTLQKAMELCDAAFGGLMTYDDDGFQLIAERGMPEAFVASRRGKRRPGPDTALGRIARGGAAIHREAGRAVAELRRASGDRAAECAAVQRGQGAHRGRRAHQADHADGARQHGRRRHVVRQEFRHSIPQSAAPILSALPRGHRLSGRIRPRHAALPHRARRLRP